MFSALLGVTVDLIQTRVSGVEFLGDELPLVPRVGVLSELGERYFSSWRRICSSSSDQP